MKSAFTHRVIGRLAVLVTGALFPAAVLDAQQRLEKPGALNPAHETIPAQLDQGRRGVGNPAGLIPKISGGRVRIQWRADGALRSAGGFFSRSYAGNPHDVARTFLK